PLLIDVPLHASSLRAVTPAVNGCHSSQMYWLISIQFSLRNAVAKMQTLTASIGVPFTASHFDNSTNHLLLEHNNEQVSYLVSNDRQRAFCCAMARCRVDYY